MTPKSSFWPGLLQSTAGNTLPIAAIALVLSTTLIGGAVDISRAYLVQNRLQAACDAGVLAGRKAVTDQGYTDAAKARASAYFAANFDQANEGSTSTSFSSASTNAGDTVAGSASTVLANTIMKIFGFASTTLTANCTATLGVGNTDIMMVLDTTGSMTLTAAGTTPSGAATSRMDDLKTAMINFYDTIQTATRGTSARVRYGFVPFSTTVNVGYLIKAANSDYLATTYTAQTRSIYKWEPAADNGSRTDYTTPSPSPLVIDPVKYSTLAACTATLPASIDWTDSGAPTAPNTVTTAIDATGNNITSTLINRQKQVQTNYSCGTNNDGSFSKVTRVFSRNANTYTMMKQAVSYPASVGTGTSSWMYRQASYDVSSYLQGNTVSTLTGTDSSGNPALVNSTWAGCIEERQTNPAASFSFSASTGITPAAKDLDIDSAPTSDDATKWKPLWPEVLYYRSTDNPATSGSKPAASCPARAQLLTKMDRNDFVTYANSLTPSGETYYDVGLLWGARLSSPTGIWSNNVNAATGNAGGVSRHMIFMTDGALYTQLDVPSAYGIESRDLRVTGSSLNSFSQLSRHRSRFLAVCEAIKAKGIRLWVISFATSLSTDLITCASTNSAYAATDGSALNTAFQNIAKEVGELRMTQ